MVEFYRLFAEIDSVSTIICEYFFKHTRTQSINTNAFIQNLSAQILLLLLSATKHSCSFIVLCWQKKEAISINLFLFVSSMWVFVKKENENNNNNKNFKNGMMDPFEMNAVHLYWWWRTFSLSSLILLCFHSHRHTDTLTFRNSKTTTLKTQSDKQTDRQKNRQTSKKDCNTQTQIHQWHILRHRFSVVMSKLTHSQTINHT